VLETVFILLEPLSPSIRMFIGSHSLPPLVRRIGPSNARPHADLAATDTPDRAARHSRAAARARPHRNAPQKIPAGSFAPRHADNHMGYSRLRTADVAAQSALVAGL
jgi:hypothetical protein